MHTLGTHFEELLKNIQPPAERLEAARDLPPYVRDYIKDCDEFPTVDPHTRLVGSYAQHLGVGDVKDVDFLVRVDGNPEANEPEAKRLIRELRSALDGLPEALGREGYTDVDIEGRGALCMSIFKMPISIWMLCHALLRTDLKRSYTSRTRDSTSGFLLTLLGTSIF